MTNKQRTSKNKKNYFLWLLCRFLCVDALVHRQNLIFYLWNIFC